MLDDAIFYYEKCLGIDQSNASTHANIAFTYHIGGRQMIIMLMSFSYFTICAFRRFERAVSSYHRALSLDPSMTICVDLLSKAIDDLSMFSDQI